ncbi:hypothetical protein ACQPZX_33525 [Actinoplanes sp. CA-142083]|uniref:hypothetical protein n=1 Tax=Actinoplanes sp. CA-142083 TaxID=3239903 RepID=UPI003D8D5E1C
MRSHPRSAVDDGKPGNRTRRRPFSEAGGQIAEHWDVVQPVPAAAGIQHGML